MGATVRVGAGTGVLVVNGAVTVVVTADHVVTSDGQVEGPVRVWSGNSWADCPVLARDDAADLAVLSAPFTLDGRGLDLLSREMIPGEELWTSGFPRGWSSTDAPVLCRGIVAGVAEERWANLEASWGNSGGPLATFVGDDAALAGIALGRAGDAHELLDEFRADVESSLADTASDEKLTALLERVEETRQDLLAHGVEVSEWQRDHDRIEHGLNRLVTEGGLRRLHNIGLSLVLDFIEDHFRTGFVRFAGANAIRKLLGTG